MSDYESRVNAYEAALLSESTRCHHSNGDENHPAATHVLSWVDGVFTLNGIGFCDDCGKDVTSRFRRKHQYRRDELTPELIAARVAYRRKRDPMPYRSTVHEVA